MTTVSSQLEETSEKLDTANEKLDETSEKLTETNNQLATTNKELTTVSGQLDTAINKIGFIQRSVDNLGEKFNRWFSFATTTIVNFAKTTQASVTKSYLKLLGNNGRISKMKIRYLVATRISERTYKVFSKSTNVDGIYNALYNIPYDGIIGPFVIGMNMNEINHEKKVLKDNVPDVTKYKTFNWGPNLDALVDELRKKHIETYEDKNDVVKYIIEQNSEFNTRLLRSLQNLLDMFVEDGMAVRPSKKDITHALEDIMKHVGHDFEDEINLSKLVKEKGATEVLAQIEELANISAC